jgi:ribosome maturation factor RimP
MDNSVVERIWQLTAPLVTEHGMEIVDIEYRREGRGHVLRVYLDRIGGGITVDDLSTMSRRLGDVVEVHDMVPGRYTLEVSSPGVNRRLRAPEQFLRYVGSKVRARTVEPLGGRRAFVGTLAEVRDEGIVLIADGEPHLIEFSNLAQANYEYEFPAAQRAKPRAGAAPR